MCDRAYFAVVDVEALCIGRINIVEQAALLMIDSMGREVIAEKHVVYQPFEASQISERYGIPLANVEASVRGYKKITGDNYVHKDKVRHEKWGAVRKRIVSLCKRYALVCYAKGNTLENAVFYNEIFFNDLAWWNCPKFPLPLHDPLQECRFFAQYVPDTMKRPFYIF